MDIKLMWILMIWIYGILAVAGERRGDEFPPNSLGGNFPLDDEESNDYSGIDGFFGSKDKHNSYLTPPDSDESFIPDIEIFLPDVYNDKSDGSRSNNDLEESKPYDYWRPLNLKSGSSKPNETLDSTGIDKSYINSILGDYYGIHPGSTDYGDYEDYDYETTTAEPEIVTPTTRSEKKPETTHLIPKESKTSTAQATSKTTDDDKDFDVFLPSSTIVVNLPPQEEPTPPPIAPTQKIRSSSTIRSTKFTISTTSTSTNQLELTTVPTTTTTSTTSSPSTSTTKANQQRSLASATKSTSNKPTTTIRTTSRNTKAASTTTTVKAASPNIKSSTTSAEVPPSTPTPHSVKSTKSSVSNKIAFKTEPVQGTTGEEKLTGHSRGSTGEEIVPEKDTTTSLSEVLPKKVQFSTVVLIISLISVVIVLVFVLVVVIVVRARLHRQGKYDIPPDSDVKSAVAESSSKTKIVNEMESGSVVVPVQYNNSVA